MITLPDPGRETGWAIQQLAQWAAVALAVVLVTASAGCVSRDTADVATPAIAQPIATSPLDAAHFEGGMRGSGQAPQPQTMAGSGSPVERPVAAKFSEASAHLGAQPESGIAAGRRADNSAMPSVGERTVTTVEAVLADGLALAGASPVHLAVRGTAGADTARCAWRGIARTAAQREDAIRFWLRLDTTDVIPSAAYLQIMFSVILDDLNPEYRETAKSNFLAIAQGGLSEEYLFLTCFADQTVSNYLLGAGPTTVTVAYNNRDEAASYELYRREHEAGTFGTEALQTRGDYEASLQDLVVAAEEALAAEIGGKERIVFLAPMGAHYAIAFEAWQAVAHWDVVTVDGTVNAVRVGAPEGDPEHTQTLANLTTRITTAAASDAHATTRVANVSGLQQKYRDMGAYGDITPGDGETTTFTPAQPPAAPTCTNGTAVTTPNANRGLVRDCETLLAAKDTLRGTATLDWSTGTAVSGWEGITTGSTPSRVTELDLPSESLTGSIPAGLGSLFELTTLDLSSNQLTGDIPAELGWLTNLTELRLSGNSLTGCIPLALRNVATNDLSSLNLLYCEPPAPTNLSAGTPGEASVALSWDAVTGAGTYRVEVRTGDPDAWTTDSDTIATTTHTVDELQCGTSYEVRVSAYGSGTTYAAAWGEPSTKLTIETAACTPPAFGAESYSFTVREDAAVDTSVGMVTATDAEGSAVTYAITDGAIAEGEEEADFAINETSGAITVARTLDHLVAVSYALTVAASDAAGGTATAPVEVRLTGVDYDAHDDGLIDVATVAQLDAIRWDPDGDGASTEAGYATAFPAAATGMGCPATGCTGYELMADLDFDTDGDGAVDADDAYWNGGAGWVPIGTGEDPFAATFEGNGHVLANLWIARSDADDVGLFGSTGTGSDIRHVGLVAMDVTGGDATGGLVGWNQGGITGSFAVGRLTSAGSDLGGLVGENTGQVTTSYAVVQVTGGDGAGGLVGDNGGTITASYTQGAVAGGKTGGLVGSNSGTITASYASGPVTATTSVVGGLVGSGMGTATVSYWDTETSGQSGSAAGTGQTTSALQTPSGYTDVYASWDVDLDGDGSGDDPWDFGSTTRYPALRVDFDGDGTASWAEFGDQRSNRPPAFAEGEATTRTVVENTAAGEAVGTPVTATDADGDVVTYALGGADAAAFALDPTSGQVRTLAALDYETRTEYALTVEASDPHDSRATIAVTITVTEFNGDYDAHDDGLIDVATLAQLNAMRWDLDGDGASSEGGYAAAFPDAATGMGCPTAGCTGYELMVDLDFDTDGSGTADAGDAYWNEGSGWEPIGTSTAKFTPTFDGNGKVIANLFVDRSSERVGLFGTSSGVVRRVGLTKVDVTGGNYVGGLVGWNEGSVTVSYVTGVVEGTGIDTGGLVGWNVGTITASYATATVTGGGLDAGGLVGGNGSQAQITASYASGTVTGTGRVGGLAGFNAGRITVSYARGTVTGTGTPTGGLVAMNIGRVTASYWDTTTSGQSSSGGGTGKTTSELQEPSGYSDTIYADWNVNIDGVSGNDDPWHFGTPSQYPVLNVEFNGDGTATWEEFGDQHPNSPPVFADGETTTRAVAENTAAGEDIGTPVAATDDDGDTLTYALGGTDAAHFALDTATGQLQTLEALDYELTPEYEVTLEVSDGKGGSASITVTISVSDLVDTPPAPANLAVGTVGETSVALSWDAVPGAAKYRVEYRVTGADTETDAENRDLDHGRRGSDDHDAYRGRAGLRDGPCVPGQQLRRRHDPYGGVERPDDAGAGGDHRLYPGVR